MGQLLVACPKRFGFAPPIVMLLMINGTALLLVTVTVCAALVVLIGWFPNAIAGATVTVDGSATNKAADLDSPAALKRPPGSCM
jgi:hypothetical protein